MAVEAASEAPSSSPLRRTTFSPESGEKGRRATRRASDKGCLPMTLEQYLQLVDWTGRQIRNDKAGDIPAAFSPILDRLDCSAESWLDLVQNFRKRFRTAVGLAKSVQSFHTARLSRRQAYSSV